ncbi:glycosyltransferase family 2 protein [Tsuneonella sp. SYSU-LHT278]|uniref:glycosyltransferase family 2 protein n=1 Tax=Tsuneonella sediminis TaxID=3416089 RepID=UPI003F7A52CE
MATIADDRRTVAVVLNWRGANDTLRCVASLVALDRPLDIVVVDNASPDGSLNSIRAELPAILPPRGDIEVREAEPAPSVAPWRTDGGRTLLLVQSGRNGGYAFGNNVGAALALQQTSTAFVWILNNDTIVPNATTLDALVARMDEDGSIGICGATVAYIGRGSAIQTRAGGTFKSLRGRCMPIGAGDAPDQPVDRDAVERELSYVNGAASFVRRQVFETIGLMREDFFLYWEEFDWARRLWPHFRLGYAPQALVLHAVGASIGTDDFGGGSPLSAYYLSRNRLRALALHAPLSLIPAIVDEMFSVLRALLSGRKEQAKARVRAILGLEHRL